MSATRRERPPGVRGPRRIARVLARARIVLYVGLVLVLLYFRWRYEFTSLPEGARSPLRDIPVGVRLVVDVHPEAFSRGVAVLFRGPAGELLLGRVADPPEGLDPDQRQAFHGGALWVLKDVPEAPGADSGELGPIPAGDLVGRVLVALPF